MQSCWLLETSVDQGFSHDRPSQPHSLIFFPFLFLIKEMEYIHWLILHKTSVILEEFLAATDARPSYSCLFDLFCAIYRT